MDFYFPDSQDQISPHFNFESEEHPPYRIRQQDDWYAHQALGGPAYTGILVSRAMVDGTGESSGRYSLPQRHQMYREGVRKFYRLDGYPGIRLRTMGDCGAFTYAKEEVPPVRVTDVINFYEECQFDAGVSVDHVILGYDASDELALPGVDVIPADWKRRREISLELASEFLKEHASQKCGFEPIGAVQGWSPASYAASATELQKMGYKRLGLGGMVSLKSKDILAVLKRVNEVRKADVEVHIFGVTRTQHVNEFAEYGVTSIDSTSPFRQAFKDDKDNYHTAKGNFVAIRVPQVDANPKLKKAILAGKVDQRKAQVLESKCLHAVRAYDAGKRSLNDVLDVLEEYEVLYAGKSKHREAYRTTLEAAPWKECTCQICKEHGVEVILFRGSERNKRRGFHNLHVFHEKLTKITAKKKRK